MGVTFALCAASALAWPTRSGAQAAERPERVRLLVPPCGSVVSWSALARALRVELRTVGSDLTEHDDAQLRLLFDVSCEGEPTAATVTAVHVASGRSHTETIPLGASRRDRARELAVSLSELVRLRYPELAREPPEPPPPPPPVIDASRFDAQIAEAAAAAVAVAMPEPEPEPEPPPPAGTLFDLGFGIGAYPAASNASAELRLGLSFASAPFRLGIAAVATGGWAADEVGEVAFGGVGLEVAVRVAHEEPGWLLAAGLRLDGGWVRGQGLPTADGATGGSVDAPHVAAALDVRMRARLSDGLWFLIAPEIGAALVGIELRSGGRRITAQIGPRIGLHLGFSVSP